MPKGLTAKQKKFVQGIASGKNATQATKEAYNVTNDLTARVIGSENLTKPNIKNALKPLLEKHNITMDTALAPIGKGLVAVKQNEYTGEITDDIGTQLKASDRALKLMGINNETPSLHFHQHIEEKKQSYDF